MGSLRTEDGRTLTYRELGRGAPLICHPGGPGFSSFYLEDLGGMGEHVSLIMLDPRGTGNSDRPGDPGAYQIEDYVEDVEALRIHLGLERIDLLGHSHGGFVVIAYAAAHPERVRSLVLASTAACFSPENIAAMEAGAQKRSGEPWFAAAHAALEAEQQTPDGNDEELSRTAMRELPLYFAHYDSVAVDYAKRLGAAEILNADALGLFNREIMRTFDLRPALKRISAPTLIITGDEDFICGPVCAAEIAAGIPQAKKVVLRDTGHFTFVESPEPFRREVVAFLEQTVA